MCLKYFPERNLFQDSCDDEHFFDSGLSCFILKPFILFGFGSNLWYNKRGHCWNLTSNKSQMDSIFRRGVFQLWVVQQSIF